MKQIVIDDVKLRRNHAGQRVQHKWDRACMVRRMTQEDSNSGSVGPFVMGLLGLETRFEHVTRRPERMEVFQVGFDCST